MLRFLHLVIETAENISNLNPERTRCLSDKVLIYTSE